MALVVGTMFEATVDAVDRKMGLGLSGKWEARWAFYSRFEVLVAGRAYVLHTLPSLRLPSQSCSLLCQSSLLYGLYSI